MSATVQLSSTKAFYLPMLSINFGSILAAYGASFLFPGNCSIYKVFNSTNSEIFLSTDGLVDMDSFISGQGNVYDLDTNALFFAPNTPIYLRYSTSAPTSGAVRFVFLSTINK
jgi:hypothetical protein